MLLFLFLLALLILCLLFAWLLSTSLFVEINSHQAKQSGHQGQTHKRKHVVNHFLPRRLLHQRNHLDLELKSSITWGRSSASSAFCHIRGWSWAFLTFILAYIMCLCKYMKIWFKRYIFDQFHNVSYSQQLPWEQNQQWIKEIHLKHIRKPLLHWVLCSFIMTNMVSFVSFSNYCCCKCLLVRINLQQKIGPDKCNIYSENLLWKFCDHFVSLIFSKTQWATCNKMLRDSWFCFFHGIC